jgi:hypothetical protein
MEAERQLEEGYRELQEEATLMCIEMEALQAAVPVNESTSNHYIPSLQAICQGHISRVVALPHPRSVRDAAREISLDLECCEEKIVDDFEDVIRWVMSKNPDLAIDNIRERLIKRKALLEATLPSSMADQLETAFAYIERLYLSRKFVNSETMLGDRIQSIPRERFLVSEDNYAWDMSELAMALETNEGVMRNPLSKEMFSESDIRKIISHPLGHKLRPLQVAQDQLKKGIRAETIQRVASMGAAILADDTLDGAPSRQAMDEFLAYVATLPENEQKAVNSLKIPATDRHSGIPFDFTIGESVRDGKANTTCFHKVGDFLSQAAVYLAAC